MASQSTVLVVLVFAAIFVVFIVIRRVDSAPCTQTCPFSSSTKVQYPFGFSNGCQIRLNCTESGDILIGNFRVRSITQDNIWVEVPPACNRSTETLAALYGDNYAPSLQNILLLVNCSSGSMDLKCPVTQNELDEMLRTGHCGGMSKKDVHCISDAYKGVSELLEHIKEHKDDCQVFFSSIAVQHFLPQVKVIKLRWGLTSCQCSSDANCVIVPLPNSKMGYQCECKNGFKGDGYLYPHSLGCKEDETDFMRILFISAALAALLLGSLSLISYVWRTKGKFRIKLKKVNTDDCQEEDLELPLFDFATLAKATNNFSAYNKLGEGGFGPVYKGILEGGQEKEIAIKRLSKSSKQGLKEFKNEVIFIAKLQHRNLVKLLGCCIEGDEKMLIYEYLPNKSLDSFIFNSTRKRALDWPKRINIINGIVRGLVYLHQDSRLRIIHRDLKASNVLLDNELNPKISDFGLARSFRADETEGNTNKVVGTHGYMPPEYVLDGHYSLKSDVFSFGVLVLEILSGTRNRGFSNKDHLNLLGHAWSLYTEGKYSELIDASMGNSFDPSEALRLFHIGLLCVQHRPEDRPSMPSVSMMLAGGGGTLPKPKQPGFYIKREVIQSTSLSSNHEICSLNEVTMTPLRGR